MSEWTIGIIGGSGLYDIDALEDAQWIEMDTPWGAPSDALLVGRIHGVKFVFLPRHGRGHRLAPTNVNARANIDALKRAGCTDVVAISAIGSLREELAPGRQPTKAFWSRRSATSCRPRRGISAPATPHSRAVWPRTGRSG